jgi:hypothetical protein
VNYGEAPAASAGPLSLLVTVAPVAGNLKWTFKISDVTSALAGHLYITTSGPIILGVQGGGSFLDDNAGSLDAPGIKDGEGVQSGISFTANKAFAALGITLGAQPKPTGTLEFLTLTTAGTQPTSLSFQGAYGYQGLDYSLAGTANVPEPAAVTLLGLGLASVVLRRQRRKRVAHGDT